MKRALWLLPIGLAALAYLPSLWGERVWDDQTALGTQLAAFDGPARALWPPAGIPDWSYAYYRPLVTLSYLLDRWLAGPDATFVPHAANLICHALTTGLVWLLATRLFGRAAPGSGAALVAAAVFAVHPIHTESVSWITGRSDVLATLFLLSAILLALRWRDQRSLPALLLSPVLLLFALLAKETAVAALLLAPLLFHFVPPAADARPGRGAATVPGAVILAAYVAAALLYLWLRHAAGVGAGESPAPGAGGIAGALAAAAAFYVRKAFVPWPQSNIVSWAMVPGPLGTALILCGAAAVTAWSGAVYRRSRDPAPFVAACWFWITTAVPLWSGVGMVSRTPFAERHLYLPSVGVALGLAWLWRQAFAQGWRKAAIAAAVAVVAAYAAGTLQRGFIWQTDLALWRNAVGQVRDQGLPWLNLGMAQWRSGDGPGALASFREVADGHDAPQIRARAQAAMGTLLVRSGELGQAEACFRAAIALRPETPEPYYGLASVYIARSRALAAAGDPGARREAAELASHFLRRALDRNARYYPARLELAGFLAEQGDWLDQHGDSAAATQAYRAALGELDALLAAFPAGRREHALAVLRSEVGLGAEDLRLNIERHISQRP